MKRKINYYEIKMKLGNPVVDCLEKTIERIIYNNRTKSDKRRRYTSTGQGMQITYCEKSLNHYYNCRITLIKDEFPGIIDRIEDVTEEIPAEYDPNKGIYEETHFVISMNPKFSKTLFAVESSMRGPKQRDIEKFFNQTLLNVGIKDEYFFEPIFAFQYENFLERISDVAEIKMVFHRDDVAKYGEYDHSTAALIRSAIDYADSEYVTLDFKINFQRKAARLPSDGLFNRAKQFIKVLRNNPEAAEHIKKLDIRAQDKNYDGKLRLFDLIESKVASEVPAERRRPTSQYYDSTSLYNAIRERLEQDFRNP